MGSSTGSIKLTVPPAKPGWGKLDAVNREFVEELVGGGASSEFLSTTGGTMTGPINFGDIWKIENVEGVMTISDNGPLGFAPTIMFVPSIYTQFTTRLEVFNKAGDSSISFIANDGFPCGLVSKKVIAAQFVSHWQMMLGTPDAASDFFIKRNDTTNAIFIERATGKMTLEVMPSIPGGAAGNILSTDGAGNLSWIAPTAPAATSSASNDALIAALNRRIETLEGIVARLTATPPKPEE